MSFNIKKHHDELLFVPLGGSGEIGMNLNLYHYQGKWLMIDCGVGFAEEYLPGVDLIVPKIDFILEHKEQLQGLVLTHTHEDHLGAIIFLWKELGCPIYATPFTSAFLKAKIADSNSDIKPNIIEVQPGSAFEVGPFTLELAELTHSVPEMNAVILKTPLGNIFHSGDWKLDPDPVVGALSDEEKIRSWGEKGILAYVGDSTNVFSPGYTKSEGALKDSLDAIIGSCKKMVMVTTFASNVARLHTISQVAKKHNRKVILAGRSLWRVVNAAKETGYLQDGFEFYEDEAISRFPRDEILIISTGCQGEPLAATNKIVNGSHRSLSLRAGDTVIFSSKVIPGNEKRIFRLFNTLARADIHVITEKDAFVHVSGHPNRDDVKRMYEWIKPTYSVPVHGEDVHMVEHAELAKSCGVKDAVKMENGHVLRLAPGEPEKVAMVEAGILAVDGHCLLEPGSNIMRVRRKIQREGAVVVHLTFSKQGLCAMPAVTAPGVLDKDDDKEILEAIAEEVDDLLHDIASTKRRGPSWHHIEQKTRQAVRRVLRYETGKEPHIEVIHSTI